MFGMRCLVAGDSLRRLARFGRSLYSSVKPAGKECNDVEIKVPWGHVSGKLWGPQDQQPILAIHGWQDNAGTFDVLAPLIMKHGPILAIDLPGHGKSSWLPPGMMYSELVYIMLVERLRRYFGWEKLKVLGHSLGAQTMFWHTSMFSKDTQYVMSIDALKPVSIEVPFYHNTFAKAVDAFFKIEIMENGGHSYTMSEIRERWKQNALSKIDDIVIDTLMARGTKEVEDGKYVLVRDPRVKIIPLVCAKTHDHLRKCAEQINCPYLFIKAKSSPYFEPKENVFDVLSIMQKRRKDVHHVELEGGHHLHITNAQEVAREINNFLDRYNT